MAEELASAPESHLPANGGQQAETIMGQATSVAQKRRHEEVESSLSNSGNDSAVRAELASASKKPKLDASVVDLVSSDLDDGEIIESSPDGSASLPNLEAAGGQDEAAKSLAVMATPDQSQAPASWNRGVTSSIRTSLGSNLTGLFSKVSRNLPATTFGKDGQRLDPDQEATGSSLTAKAGDLREPPSTAEDFYIADPSPTHTTVSGLGKSAISGVSQSAVSSPRPSQGETSIQARNEESFPIPPFVHADVTWTIPPNDSEKWPKKFEIWCRDFLTANQENLHLTTSQLVLDAYLHYLDALPLIPPKEHKRVNTRATTCKQQGKIDLYINEVQAQGQAQTRSDDQTSAPRPLTFHQVGVNWKLPSLNVSPSAPGIKNAQHFETWKSRFEGWTKEFLDYNQRSLQSVTEDIVLDAYFYLVDNSAAISKNLRRTVKGSSSQSKMEGKVNEFITVSRANAKRPDAADLDGSQVKPKSNGRVDAHDMEVEDNEQAAGGTEAPVDDGAYDLTALEGQLRRYFPGVSTDAQFCITCASQGHRANACPQRLCTFCQGKHFSYACPTRQRCDKCRQLGHSAADCGEKLVAAPGEDGFECAFCDSTDHTEDACPEIWRTYRPNPENIKKVKSLPVFCYSCGAQGHYGGECGLAGARSMEPPSETWTKACRDLYLDPDSTADAIALENLQPAVAPPGKPSIPGRSIVPRTHVFFEESDDDADQGFLKAPVSKPQPHGQITIASNIDFTLPKRPMTSQDPEYISLRDNTNVRRANTSNDRNYPQSGRRGTNVPANPPLPPGPPPPFPPGNDGQNNQPSQGRGGRGGRRGGRGGNRQPQNQGRSNQNNGQQQGKSQARQGPQNQRGGGNQGRGGGRGRGKRGRGQ
ncbi:hypothetical protein NKR23_g1423 [Pleurostoma richardsiae]|uniref:CCHC-type domain-containing protein n=1 Tax=Pleurostoma richardsiae TaxID=41990 RepID=A0AA38VX18_9PEZI|nr:hypothetical protein NKR23_g1423 [Pleurostoma richardsiae]